MNDEYADLIKSLFEALEPGAPRVQEDTLAFLQRELDKRGGYLGWEAGEAYLRGELP